MSGEIAENQVELEEVQVDTPEVDEHDGESSHDGDEGEAEEKPEPEKFRAWKQQPKEQTHIPYSRFAEVNEDARRYRGEAEELRNRLAEYEKMNHVTIKSPDDLRIEDYDDPKAYLRDYGIAVRNQAVQETRDAIAAERAEENRQTLIREQSNRYMANLNRSISENPEIQEAVDWFDQRASNIHPAIARELITDDNVGELIYEIATDQEAINRIFSGDVHGVIRDLHRRSALIDYRRKEGAAPRARMPSNPTPEIPKAMPKTAPKVLRSGKASYSPKDIENMSQEQYTKLRKEGKI